LEELHNHGRGLNQRLLIKMSLAYQKDLLIKKTCFPERSLPFRKGTVRQDLLIARTGLNIRPASNHL
jgi:hypothetical protein